MARILRIRIGSLALALTASLVLAVPAGTASAAGLSVRVTPLSGGTFKVSGRTAAPTARVTVLRRAATGWKRIGRATSRRHRFALNVRLSLHRPTRLKVRTAGVRPRIVTVRPPAQPRAPVPTYDACGLQPRKSDGTVWQCTFVDDFGGSQLDRTKWIPQTVFVSGSPTTYACYADDPANVGVADGVLKLTLRWVDEPVDCGIYPGTTHYVSGMVSTWHRFSQQYGRFEARVKTTATSQPGLHEAFWMWPDDRYPTGEKWPVAGEIDIAETYSVVPEYAVPALHYSADQYGRIPGVNIGYGCIAPRGEWNTYTLVWKAASLEIYINGKLCLRNTSGDPAFQKRYIIDLTQSLGSNFDAPTEQTPIPATMQVDYVRVWQ